MSNGRGRGRTVVRERWHLKYSYIREVEQSAWTWAQGQELDRL